MDKLTGIVGVPGRERGRWASFGDCVDELELPPHVIVRRALSVGGSVAWARNAIAQEALERGAEWVFYLDDDLMFRPNVLMQMLRHSEEIVIGHTLMRHRVNGDDHFRPIWSTKEIEELPWPDRNRWEPVTKLELEPNGMMKLLYGTSGGMMVRRAVFEKIPPPWWMVGQISPDVCAEDLSFCRLVRAHGFDVWGDPAIKFGHTMPVTSWPHQMEDGRWATVLAHGFNPFLIQPWPTEAQ